MVTQVRALGSSPGFDGLKKRLGVGHGGGGEGPLKSPTRALDLETSRCSEHISSPHPPPPLRPLLFIVLPLQSSALEKCP